MRITVTRKDGLFDAYNGVTSVNIDPNENVLVITDVDNDIVHTYTRWKKLEVEDE